MSSSKRVLVIEDNQGDLDLIRSGLMEGKSEQTVLFEISSADRLSAGLMAVTKQRPSVVLLDLYLPDSQGAATFKSVINSAPDIPVVVLSARDDEDLMVDAVQNGVQDYLVKGGFDSKHLVRTLRYAIERQTLLTALGMGKKGTLRSDANLLSPVWHDVLTALTSIHKGITSVLVDLATPISEDQQHNLDAALRGVTHLRSMVEHQLENTRAES
jgi:DNA-binding NarL/FixJ family response regulator